MLSYIMMICRGYTIHEVIIIFFLKSFMVFRALERKSDTKVILV